ncbi:hypothetical protein [Haloarchaeobius amylolyticus]|uniref:hypothetical protein n=1 Tax=Haloarchaeobius amylolyticus TaxID=1198296 RepID=UPI00226D5653|nr:hypothetical protein [Haloarchaeobius amylolyticus]
MQTPSTLAEFIGTSESPIVVYDPQLEKRDRTARAQLRSIPFFQTFGVDSFLYDSLWEEEFQLVEHQFHTPTGVHADGLPFPLVQLTTTDQLKPRHRQEFEHEDISQADLTWELFKRATNEDEPYIFVSDTDAPQVPTRTPSIGRSVADQFDAVTFEYEQLIHDYVDAFVDSRLPLSDTKNLYFHQISECHAAHDAPASTLPELFDYERAPSESPIWDPLYYFIEHELEEILNKYTAHVTSALRSWVEYGDTEKIAKKMIATLHRCDFDTEQLANYQQNSNR